MKIIQIQYPKVVIDNGDGIEMANASEFETQPSLFVGAEIEKHGGRYKVVGKAVSEDCINGVCPVR